MVSPTEAAHRLECLRNGAQCRGESGQEQNLARFEPTMVGYLLQDRCSIVAASSPASKILRTGGERVLMPQPGDQQKVDSDSDAQDFSPYVSPLEQLAEFTLKATIAGILFGILFGAANAYLGLRVGLTISTSIPVAVLTAAAFCLPRVVRERYWKPISPRRSVPPPVPSPAV